MTEATLPEIKTLVEPESAVLEFNCVKETAVVPTVPESHWLAAVATRRQLPFLAVRVILDAADQSLPPAAMACVRTDGSISMAGLAGSLALRPTQLAALSRLAGAQRKAASSLLGCCRRGGPAGFGVR